jgi:hypothetical protein
VTQVWSGSNVRRSDSREQLVFPALKARASLHARAIGEEVPVTWTEKSHAPALHATYRSPISRRVVPPSADWARSILILIFLLQRDIELLFKIRISLPSHGGSIRNFSNGFPSKLRRGPRCSVGHTRVCAASVFGTNVYHFSTRTDIRKGAS